MAGPDSIPPSATVSTLNLHTHENIRPGVKRDVSFLRSCQEYLSPTKENGGSKGEKDQGKDPAKLPVRERIRHFTWTWFTMTMATGGIANVMYGYIPQSGLLINQTTLYFMQIQRP